MRRLLCLLLLCLMAGSGAFAATDPFPADYNETAEFHDPFAAPEGKPIEDPLESLNRVFFRLNDLIYTRLLLPLSRAVGTDVQDRVTAVLAACEEPVRFSGLELKIAFRDGGSEFGRFIMHGLLDLLHRADPVSTHGLQNGEEDFGKVLAALGVDPGIYLVLPLFGPSSLRDGIGHVTSFYIDPSPHLCRPEFRRQVTGETSFAGALQAYEEIRRQTLDPYLFLRDAYAQQLASAERRMHPSPEPPAENPENRRFVRHAGLL